MKVCILTIATNKYIQFVERLYNNIEENFLNGHDIECLLFTDHEVETSDNVKVCQIEHEPWPMPTLKRYNYFIKEKQFISKFDYCYYFDVDMAIVDKVGDEVLGDLVATKHPGQSFHSINEMSYERNQNSLAYVPYDKGHTYYAGGFNGGKTKNFLEMSEVISQRVNTDLENGIIALWHDESHMNRYLIDTPPSLTLTSAYCYPESALKNPQGWVLSSFYPEIKPKIIALDKNHNETRF
jgi:histo-blood group ABO system transferase